MIGFWTSIDAQLESDCSLFGLYLLIIWTLNELKLDFNSLFFAGRMMLFRLLKAKKSLETFVLFAILMVIVEKEM